MFDFSDKWSKYAMYVEVLVSLCDIEETTGYSLDIRSKSQGLK